MRALLVLAGAAAAAAFAPMPRARVGSRLSASSMTHEAVVANVLEKLSSAQGADARFVQQLSGFLAEYETSAVTAGMPVEEFGRLVTTMVTQVQAAFVEPHQFSGYHQAVREPLDLYEFGNAFIKPLVIAEESTAMGGDIWGQVEAQLDAGENVIFLSNHQSEIDPQVMSILFEDIGHPSLGERVVCVAGHKVTTDPLAIPLSMGRNLLCIHSKKHMTEDDRASKQAANLVTMRRMGKMLKEGGTLIWVAPSGGRDRPGDDGVFKVAPFDDKAVEMFRLMSSKTSTPTHMYPMAMFTHRLLPPPKSVDSALGEARSAARGAVSISIGPEIDPSQFDYAADKEAAIAAFAAAAQASTESQYADLQAFHAAHEKQ